MYMRYLQDIGVDTAHLWDELVTSAPWVSRSDPIMLYRGNQLKRGSFCSDVIMQVQCAYAMGGLASI
jgi:hypothetical protein